MHSSPEFMILIGSWLIAILAYLVAIFSAKARLKVYNKGRYEEELPRFYVAEAVYTVATMLLSGAFVLGVMWTGVSNDQVYWTFVTLAAVVAFVRFMYVLRSVRAGIPYLKRKLGIGSDRIGNPVRDGGFDNVGTPHQLDKLRFAEGVDTDGDTLDS